MDMSAVIPQDLSITASPTFAGLTVSNLTNGRIVLAGASGLLTDSSAFTYSGTDLTATGTITAGQTTIGEFDAGFMQGLRVESDYGGGEAYASVLLNTTDGTVQKITNFLAHSVYYFDNTGNLVFISSNPAFLRGDPGTPNNLTIMTLEGDTGDVVVSGNVVLDGDSEARLYLGSSQDMSLYSEDDALFIASEDILVNSEVRFTDFTAVDFGSSDLTTSGSIQVGDGSISALAGIYHKKNFTLDPSISYYSIYSNIDLAYDSASESNSIKSAAVFIMDRSSGTYSKAAKGIPNLITSGLFGGASAGCTFSERYSNQVVGLYYKAETTTTHTKGYTSTETSPNKLVGTYLLVNSSPTFNEAGGYFAQDNIGIRAEITSDPTLTAGAELLVNTYGLFIDITGSAVGTSKSYGVYVDTLTGADDNYFLYDANSVQSVHSGNLRVGGTTDPSNALDVTGASTFGGSSDYAGISSTGDLTFAGSAGLAYGEISAESNNTATGLTMGVSAQVGIFDTNGASNNTTPTAASDYIVVGPAGHYLVICSITLNSSGGTGSLIEVEVKKNTGASTIIPHMDRTLAGGGGESGCMTLSGIADLSASDSVEVWVENESNNDDIVIEDICLSVLQIGGT